MGDVIELETCVDCGAAIDEEADGQEGDGEGKHVDPAVCVAALKARMAEPHFGAKVVAASLAESLGDAPNFVEIGVQMPDGSEATVTLTRKDGKSPGERVAELTKEVEWQRARLVAIRDLFPEGTDVLAQIKSLQAKAMVTEQIDAEMRAALREAVLAGLEHAMVNAVGGACGVTTCPYDDGTPGRAMWMTGVEIGIKHKQAVGAIDGGGSPAGALRLAAKIVSAALNAAAEKP